MTVVETKPADAAAAMYTCDESGFGNNELQNVLTLE